MPILSQPIAPPYLEIKKLPYDVLREIFIHCLPEYPLQNCSWNPNGVPIVLCHTCSFWRMVALTTPKLWSHLTCCLHMYYMDPKLASESDLAFRKNEIDRLRWWDRNRGQIPLFLYIDIIKIDRSNPKNKKDESLLVNADTESITFVMNFFTSPQYLHANTAFWDEIRHRMKRGEQIRFANLHTQVLTDRLDNRDYSFLKKQLRISSSNNVLPSLRRLHIAYGSMMKFLRDSPFPSHWSTLTHISLFDVQILFDFWCLLIRSVPCLQWGYFDIHVRDFDEDNNAPEATEYTQSNLMTLFIVSYSGWCPLSSLFTRLRLPALQALTLHSTSRSLSWTIDPDAITEICAILQSTPNITTLTLTDEFLSLNREYTTPELDDIEPIWKYAPRLVHLRIEAFISSVDKRDLVDAAFDRLVNSLFFDNEWLQLENPECPIRKITLIDGREEVINDHGFDACLVHQVIRDMPFIDIQVALRPAIYHDIMSTWKEWGAKLI